MVCRKVCSDGSSSVVAVTVGNSSRKCCISSSSCDMVDGSGDTLKSCNSSSNGDGCLMVVVVVRVH